MTRLAPLLLVVAVGVAGCAGGGGAKSASTASATNAAETTTATDPAPAATTSSAAATTTAAPPPAPPGGIARRFSSACAAQLRRAETASTRRVASEGTLQRRIARDRRSLQKARAKAAAVRSRLDAAYQRAIANRTNANVDAYNGLLPAANAVFSAFNGKVRAFNAKVEQANGIARTSNRAQPGYERIRDRCLRAIRDWPAATRDLNTALVPPSKAGGTEAPTIVCDAPRATPKRGRFHELGRVDLATNVMHLAAVTCLGLERAIADPAKLRCVKAARPRYVSCPVGLADAALAIVTLAHEQQHIDGTRNEAETECYAYQRSPAVAQALGVDPAAAAGVGRFAANAVVVPPQYRSRRCKKGGVYDLRLPDAPDAWSYTGVATA